MFDPFATALSALNANSLAISVTGDNLTNLNTTAFKSSRVEFTDLVTQFVTDGLEVGAGVGRPSTRRQYIQGALETTGSSLDAAIKGNGFFVTRDGSGTQLFTRAGNFTTDANGNLTTFAGDHVQGWVTTNGVLSASGPIDDIVVPTNQLLAPTATDEVALRLNLDANEPVGATFAAPMAVYDSLGADHVLTFVFTKTSSTDWDYDVLIPGEDLAAGTPGTPSSLTTGTISFGPDGLVATPAPPGTVALSVTGLANGALDMAIDWDLFTGTSESLLTQYAQPSAVSSVDQNGEPPAQMIDIEILSGGILVARFTNGRQQPIAQLAIAAIANPGSLASAGGNSFRLTSDTSSPAIGPGGTGGRGEIRGASLESSTVDIASEFTKLIRYQRSYQAAAKLVTAADEITVETLNLKR